jgi:hypothetical protein
VDENENIVMQGVGRTLNFSESGVLLETHVAIDPKHAVSLFIAMGKDLVDVKGRVIHTSPKEDGKYNTGIAFVENTEAAQQIIKESVAVFQNKT